MAVAKSIRCVPRFLLQLLLNVFIMSTEMNYCTVQCASAHFPHKRSQIGRKGWEDLWIVIKTNSSALCSARKTGGWEVPGSILSRACQPSRSRFSVVFSKARVNTRLDPLERLPPPNGGHSTHRPWSFVRQSALKKPTTSSAHFWRGGGWLLNIRI